MVRYWRSSFAIMLGAMLLSLVGCGNIVKMDISSEKELNIVGAGSPLPVVVRVYQLSDDAAFRSAGFRDLWKHDAETLGPALLSSKEIVMQPDSKEKISVPLNEKTKFVAGFAIFRSPGSAKWSFVQPVSDGMIASIWHKAFPVSVSLRLNQNKIEIDN
jgi:type VI secretion system protein VasD